MTALEKVQGLLPGQAVAWGDLFNTGSMYEGMYLEQKRQWFLISEFYRPESIHQIIECYVWIAVFSICIADYLTLQITPSSP